MTPQTDCKKKHDNVHQLDGIDRKAIVGYWRVVGAHATTCTTERGDFSTKGNYHVGGFWCLIEEVSGGNIAGCNDCSGPFRYGF